jgi:hypothetical protein
MGIPIEKRFVIKAPAAAVWDFLTDPVKVASCLPGAAITGKLDDQTWGGTMTVKVGPVTASYRGKIRFERLDAAAREAEIAASGQETRGKGGADMRMKSRVVELAPGETEVTVSSDVNVVGVLAQFGRGMIQDVSDQIFLKFTEGMRRQLEGGGAAGGAAGTPATAATQPAATVPAGPAGATAPAASATGAAGAATAPPRAATEPPRTAPATETPPAPAAGGAPAPAGTSATPVQGSAAAGGAAEENVLDVGSLGASAFGRAAARALRRPAFWIAVAVAGLVIYWLVGR